MSKTAMTKITFKYFDILAAKKAYAEGKNITELLKNQKNIDINSSEIIETAYDLQAGNYIENVKQNPTHALLYTNELAEILDQHINPQDTILDIGTGELTTISLVMNKLVNKPKRLFAFDISWSRIHKGLAFAQKTMVDGYDRLTPFVADINEIPLLDKSVNITTSSHALEPNGGKLGELLSELFRVTVEKLVLFEPCYEMNSDEGKQRMDRLGYIKDVDGMVEKLGGKVIEKIQISNTGNPLNPTVCFVIEPPKHPTLHNNLNRADIFSVPGSNHPIQKMDDFYFSNETGLCFPILKSIPILKSNTAILASALIE